MSTTYELRTIQDIFVKIPGDKIRECMLEIAEVVVRAHLAGLVPESISWVDDGLRNVTMEIPALPTQD